MSAQEVTEREVLVEWLVFEYARQGIPYPRLVARHDVARLTDDEVAGEMAFIRAREACAPSDGVPETTAP